MATDPWIQILQKAGFRGDALRTAYAVSMAEGGNNNRAFNGNRATGDQSYGRFQINMLGALGPDRRKRYGLRSNEDLFDPMTNARVAFQMSNGGRDWSPWSAFKNNSYKQYLDDFPGAGPVPQGAKGHATPAPVQQQGFEAVDDSSRRQALLSYVMANNASFAATGRIDPGASLGALVQAFNSPAASPQRTPGEVTPQINANPAVVSKGKGMPWQKMVESIKKAQAMGLRVGENPFVDKVDPVHTKTSYHYRTFPGNPKVGRGADISGDAAQMMAFSKWFHGRFGGGAELFYDPYGGWKHGRSIGPIGGHGGHVHIAF